MAKRGPKPKVTEAAKKTIYQILTVSGSLDDAAGILGIDSATIYRALKTDAKFAEGVRKARKVGKLKLIKKVGNARPWQAAAFLLERRHGAEFGRKDHVKSDNKHTIKIVDETIDNRGSDGD